MPALELRAQGQDQAAHEGRDALYSAGEAFYWAPGHAPEAAEDAEFIDFSPTAEFDAVVKHVAAQLA
ncbi:MULTISPECIES: hypothetical protein [unclassified Streptomyces]|uniref:hypothetical protein n=1 Tax=unclassified Streptomyces TaxID=2593676 RepID=UPI00381CFBF5